MRPRGQSRRKQPRQHLWMFRPGVFRVFPCAKATPSSSDFARSLFRRLPSTVRAMYQTAATDARQQYLLKLWVLTTALLAAAQEVMRDNFFRP